MNCKTGRQLNVASDSGVDGDVWGRMLKRWCVKGVMPAGSMVYCTQGETRGAKVIFFVLVDIVQVDHFCD